MRIRGLGICEQRVWFSSRKKARCTVAVDKVVVYLNFLFNFFEPHFVVWDMIDLYFLRHFVGHIFYDFIDFLYAQKIQNISPLV